ncbi:MAG: gephyrin-like molybdotransferase Glp [Cyanophyceae cyanobacterium]
MLPAKQAESIILGLLNPLCRQSDFETVAIDDASGRVLAMPVAGKLDIPHWDNSAMDGYAVRYADVNAASAEAPAVLKVVEEIAAGCVPQQLLQTGQAARIFTGAMLPEGADTIVIQENTQREAEKVKVLTAPQPGEFVRHQGEFYRAGEPLLMPGVPLHASQIAVLASVQQTEITVYRRPRVAILSTGDELVSPEQKLQPGQIVDSNQVALGTLVAEHGGLPIRLGIIPDQRAALQEAIQNAIADADIVLSTGGVSVGDYDYVEQVLAELGGEIHIRSVAVKPGKPLTVAAFPNGCLYFGLPGNPVSALVSCWRFVLPALKKLAGLTAWQPQFVEARSLSELRSGGKRETYLWGQLRLVKGNYHFELAGGSHSSGNLINLAQTNSLAVVPVGQTCIAAGERVEVMQIG